jgi:hypothetical protein
VLGVVVAAQVKRITDLLVLLLVSVEQRRVDRHTPLLERNARREEDILLARKMRLDLGTYPLEGSPQVAKLRMAVAVDAQDG